MFVLSATDQERFEAIRKYGQDRGVSFEKPSGGTNRTLVLRYAIQLANAFIAASHVVPISRASDDRDATSDDS